MRGEPLKNGTRVPYRIDVLSPLIFMAKCQQEALHSTFSWLGMGLRGFLVILSFLAALLNRLLGNAFMFFSQASQAILSPNRRFIPMAQLPPPTKRAMDWQLRTVGHLPRRCICPIVQCKSLSAALESHFVGKKRAILGIGQRFLGIGKWCSLSKPGMFDQELDEGDLELLEIIEGPIC